MRILKLDIPKSFHDNGIEDIKMDRLGPIVLISAQWKSSCSMVQ